MSFDIHTADPEYDASPTTPSGASQDVTSRLLARPKLAARAGALMGVRQQEEAKYRLSENEKDETHPAGWAFGLAVALVRCTLKASGFFRRGVRNAKRYRVVSRTLAVPDLPDDLDGFRLLHISDFHLPRRVPEVARAMGKMLEGVETDVCVLTGDYRFGYYGPPEHIIDQLRVILAGVRSRYGVATVLGNHDTFNMGQMLENAGFPILFNEGIGLNIGSTAVWICGVDETHNYGCDRIEAAVRDAPDKAFKILLAHTPERVRKAEAHGVAVYLTGHTHGGQIRLPIVGALLKNARCARSQVWGAWRYKRMVGHTTCGIGVTDVPVRFNCPPEAVLLVLRRL